MPPALDHFGPAFGYQEPRGMPRQMEHLSDSVGGEIDAVAHIREFSSQAHHHHAVPHSKHSAIYASQNRDVLAQIAGSVFRPGTLEEESVALQVDHLGER